jgi:hypothetical protein
MTPAGCACRVSRFCTPGAGKHDACTADECKVCHPGKHPITPRGLNDASTDPTQIATWWGLAPEANVGVAIPDGLCVVDVDPRNGGDESFSRLEAELGFPLTRMAKTGGGGAHLWYRLPEGWALPGKIDGVKYPGIDIKQKGGYVLAPPSNHESGARYEWASAPTATIHEAPTWLAALGHVRGEGALVIVDEDERVATDAELDAIVAAVEPHFVRGRMHDICKNLSGWMKQRGFGLSDAAYVIEHLPCRNVKNGLGAAKAAFRIDRAFGWKELRGLIGEAPAAHLDASAPNPRRARELEDRAATASMVEAMAANAVPAAVVSPALPPVAASPADVARWAEQAATSAPAGADPWAAWAQEIDLTKEPPEMPWIIRDLEIGPGRPTAILGYANSAKTPFALALAVAIAAGVPVLGFPVKCGRVAWLAYEATRISHAKAMRVARGLGVGTQNMRMFRMQKLLTEPGAVEALVGFVQRSQSLVCFIDTYSSAIAGVDHNAPEFAEALRVLEKISDATGVTFVVLVHSKKEQNGDLTDFAGHNSAAGAVQVVIGLNRPDPEDKFTIGVSCIRELDRPFPYFQVRFVDAGDAGQRIAGGALQLVRVSDEVKAPPKDENVEAIEKVMAFLRSEAPEGAEIKYDVIVSQVRARDGQIRKALSWLEHKKQVRFSRGSPRMVALNLHAPAFDPASVAPPPLPSTGDSYDAYAAALRAQQGEAAE